MFLKPSEVFVPGQYPIEASNAYADRGEKQAQFVKTLNRLSVPLVYGGYGVGKSSMAMYCAKHDFSDHQVVYIESVYGKELPDIFRAILQDAGYEVAVERTRRIADKSTAELEGEAEAGLFGLIKARLKGTVGVSSAKADEVKYEITISGPTDREIFRICEEHCVLLILDELHRGSSTLINDLSAFIKAYSNSQRKHFKVALLGTSGDPTRLVIKDPGIDRALTEISLSNMTSTEAAEIIQKGMKSLNLRVDTAAKERIISAAVGSPFIIQYLCLEASEHAVADMVAAITVARVNDALTDYATKKAQRMIRDYLAAIETVGAIRYRKNILRAMANLEDEYVTMEQLVEGVSRLAGRKVPSTAISGPLRNLKSDRFGRILTDIEHPSRSRVYNYSAFRDPAMKSIIRFIETYGIENLPKI